MSSFYSYSAECYIGKCVPNIGDIPPPSPNSPPYSRAIRKVFNNFAISKCNMERKRTDNRQRLNK